MRNACRCVSISDIVPHFAADRELADYIDENDAGHDEEKYDILPIVGKTVKEHVDGNRHGKQRGCAPRRFTGTLFVERFPADQVRNDKEADTCVTKHESKIQNKYGRQVVFHTLKE